MVQSLQVNCPASEVVQMLRPINSLTEFNTRPSQIRHHLQGDGGQHRSVTVQQGPEVNGVLFPLLRQPPRAPSESVDVPMHLRERLDAEPLAARPLTKARQLPAQHPDILTHFRGMAGTLHTSAGHFESRDDLRIIQIKMRLCWMQNGKRHTGCTHRYASLLTTQGTHQNCRSTRE